MKVFKVFLAFCLSFSVSNNIARAAVVLASHDRNVAIEESKDVSDLISGLDAESNVFERMSSESRPAADACLLARSNPSDSVVPAVEGLRDKTFVGSFLRKIVALLAAELNSTDNSAYIGGKSAGDVYRDSIKADLESYFKQIGGIKGIPTEVNGAATFADVVLDTVEDIRHDVAVYSGKTVIQGIIGLIDHYLNATAGDSSNGGSPGSLLTDLLESESPLNRETLLAIKDVKQNITDNARHGVGDLVQS